MDITEINNTIEELESGPTTFDACMKLSSLYIVRDRLEEDNVVSEYRDILPTYDAYIDCKTRYQMGQAHEDSVTNSLDFLCTEIYEFIYTLYSCANTDAESKSIQALLIKLNNIL